jgi:hypothetical protein
LITAQDRDRYRLSPEHSEHVFQTQIAPSLLRAEPAKGRPILVQLKGQPGAGKTALGATLAVHGKRVDVDEFRPFHPAYQQLRAASDLTADELVQADARRWFEMAIRHLTALRADIIAEHVIPDKDLTQCSEAGYGIGAALLAVPAAISRLRAIDRYQIAMEATGAGRHISQQTHDLRYRDLPRAADALESDRRTEAVYVYRHTAEPVYGNVRRPGEAWQHPPAARAALERERSRSWTLAESREFLDLHASLARRIPQALEADLQDALSRAGPLLHPAAHLAWNPAASLSEVPLSQNGHLIELSFPVSLAEAIRQAPAGPASRSRTTPPTPLGPGAPGRGSELRPRP